MSATAVFAMRLIHLKSATMNRQSTDERENVMGEVAKIETAQSDATALIQTIERAALNPAVDVEKMERLFALQERMIARHAETSFNAAMTAAQSEMGRISADAENPQTRSMYASYGKLDSVLRPVYTRNGFSLSFDEGESPKPDHVRVLCHVAHSLGHSRIYHKDICADGKGAKGGDVMTKTHASGAAMSYGMRYLLKGIFNVAIGEEDTDGNQPAQQEKAPSDYENWKLDMTALADEGLERLKAGWSKSAEDLRRHATKVDANWWAIMKAKAAKVQA